MAATSFWRLLISISLLGGMLAMPGTMAQAPAPKEASPASPGPPLDVNKLTVQQRTFYASTQRAKDWLQKANKKDGRFVYGFLPALRVPMEGDNYTRQAGAAFALARAARFSADKDAAAIAKQALLTLLMETTTDPQDPSLRTTAAPPSSLNRLAACGTLVAAIYDLPSPAQDLLEQADQLCNYLRRQQQNDGSLSSFDAGEPIKLAVAEMETYHAFAGPALYGIMRSHQARPAPWKLDLVRKARGYYFAHWKQTKNLPLVPWLTAAFAEAYAVTKEDAFAEAVLEMNDWLLTLQYPKGEGQRAPWTGGFMPWFDGKAATLQPDIQTAPAAESLAHACRVARLKEDLPRLRRYRAALENALAFLTTLQYNDSNCSHFAEWYRPLIVGAFHASHQDGNLRLDYTHHALSALVCYWNYAAEFTQE